MTDGLDISPFDRSGASDEDCRALWAFTNDIILEVLPDEPLMPYENWVVSTRATSSLSETLGWVVWDACGSRILGSTSLSVSGSDAVRASMHVSVDPSIRRMGFGRRMLGLAAEAAESKGRTVLMCQSNGRCPAGAAFLEKAGARRMSESHTNRLLLDELDKDLVKRWLDLPRNLPVEFEIRVWREGIPEALFEEARDFFQEIYDTTPRQEGIPRVEIRYTTEMIREGNRISGTGGMRNLALAAVTSEGRRLIGYTQVAWHPSKPGIVNQHYTAVRPEYRHRGLARRLKAEMLSMIATGIPGARSIRTGNDDCNEAILAINREMGFEPFISRTHWALDVAAAREYLHSSAGGAG